MSPAVWGEKRLALALGVEVEGLRVLLERAYGARDVAHARRAVAREYGPGASFGLRVILDRLREEVGS